MPTGLIKHREGHSCRSQKALGATSLPQAKLWSMQSMDHIYPSLSFSTALKRKRNRCRKQSLCDQCAGARPEDGGFALQAFDCQNILLLRGKNKCSPWQWSNRVSTERTVAQDLERVWFCLGNELPFHNVLALHSTMTVGREWRQWQEKLLMFNQKRLMGKGVWKCHNACP